MRRTLDFSGNRTLLKAGSVELRVEDVGESRCEASLTADLASERGEYLSLAGILGTTLAVLFVLAGIQSPLFFLGVLPAFAAPVFGFRFAYGRACLEMRRALDDLLDAVEVAIPCRGPPERSTDTRLIQVLKPIPRFAEQGQEGESLGRGVRDPLLGALFARTATSSTVSPLSKGTILNLSSALKF